MSQLDKGEPVFSIAIHGGAGTILPEEMKPELEEAYRQALKAAVDEGYEILAAGGSAIDAVMAATISLEDCPLFNAGRGAVFTHEGGHELDASLMNGADLAAGAVAGVTGVRNPILLAREVMLQTQHVLLAGEGAMSFARACGIPLERPEYFFTEFRHRQWTEVRQTGISVLDHSTRAQLKGAHKMGTVGAVARDQQGNLAAATSTGGMTNKQYGRVGDSPVIGAGTWADNHTCAISCTGHGELFLKAVAAYDVHARMLYGQQSLQAAMHATVHEKLVEMGGEGGMIGIDASGHVSMMFNSAGMYRASRVRNQAAVVNIYKD
jgi:beta-aspartyl-peptidase (threonine type)